MSTFRKIWFKNKLLSAIPFLAELCDVVDLALATRRWRVQGWSSPVHPLVKRSMLLAEARRIQAANIVESGTYQGDTVWFFREKIGSIVSIEVQPRLAMLAKARFKGWKNIRIVEGDSGDVLPEICDTLIGPTLFWLDGHYSGGVTGTGREECPLWRELEAITKVARHPWSVFIDDARLFGVDPAYPTMEALRNYILTRCPQYRCEVENDIIKIFSNTTC